MSNIPLARKRLKTLQHLLTVVVMDLEEIEKMLKRKEPVRKAAPSSKRMTPEVAAQIRKFAQRNSKASLQEIATRFNVNSGRVSEALNGVK